MSKPSFAEACRRLLELPAPVVAAGPDPAPPPMSYHPDDPRLLACVRGHLRLAYGTADGACRCALPPGGVAILPPGTWFAHHATRDCLLYNIGLRSEGIDLRLRRRRGGLWHGDRTGLILHDRCPPHIGQAIRCACALALGAPDNHQALRHAAHAVFALLAAALDDGLPVCRYRNSRQDVRWRQLKECVCEHLDQDLDRSRVAALLDIHPNHVSRLCARQGTRFVDLVQGQRLQMACRMLGAEETPVAVIAHRCGFGSSQYFSRVFRRRYGCSPSRWRSG